MELTGEYLATDSQHLAEHGHIADGIVLGNGRSLVVEPGHKDGAQQQRCHVGV